MKTASEIIEEIDLTMEALDKLVSPVEGDETGEYAKRKANKDYMEKKLKGTVQKIKSEGEGSDASRTMHAEGSEGYFKELWELAKAQGMSYQVQATKDLLEARLDVLRTKLSYIKSTIDNRM